MLFLRRKKFSCEFYEEPITSIKIVLQRKFFFSITCNPEMIGRCLSSSAVFRCVTARKKNQKSQKERSQLYIECECRTTGNIGLKLGQDCNSVVTLSIISAKHVASQHVGRSNHKMECLQNLSNEMWENNARALTSNILCIVYLCYFRILRF